MCSSEEVLSLDKASEWRAIKAENKIYYFCRDCQPIKTGMTTTDDWQKFYFNAVSLIHKTDFNRPIRRLLILRDVGGNPQIINPNLN